MEIDNLLKINRLLNWRNSVTVEGNQVGNREDGTGNSRRKVLFSIPHCSFSIYLQSIFGKRADLILFGLGSVVLFCSTVLWLYQTHLPKPKATKISPVTPQLTKAIAAFSYRLVVDLSDAKVYSYWGDKLISSYPVAVGKPGWETPQGNFHVFHKQRNPIWQEPITGELIAAGPNNPLGDRWIGFWSDGHHQIGFHGTNQEQLVGQAVSHGCLRMRNRDIQALYQQVSIRTPVVVRD
ncbi:MAG: L,D-transpeptidase [Symploca sp. SIO3C6]|nr:L,D-transpeptidase [Symploca sp. SIO3C6]